MITGREKVSQYFTLFLLLAQVAGVAQDTIVERVMELMQESPATQIATYQAWIRDLAAALATGPTGEGE